jgi:co-chaperonin GroES (HSP10)
MSKLEPLNGVVILRAVEVEETTHGNIVLPHLEHQSTILAEVIATSDQYNFNTGEWVPCWFKEGDKVLINRMGGAVIWHEDKEYLAVQFNSIMAKIV